MRRFVVIFGVCAIGVCVPAQAKVTPPGNSAVNQYIESIPTDHGSQPTRSVHPSAVAGGGGGGGGGGVNGGSSGGGVSGGGGGSSGATTGAASSGSSVSSVSSGSAISQSTQRALDAHGASGKAAAALARNTAPATPVGHRAVGTSAKPDATTAGGANGGSPALGSLVSALTGSSSSGGLGALLPIILVVALFGSAAMAVLRRRGHT